MATRAKLGGVTGAQQRDAFLLIRRAQDLGLSLRAGAECCLAFHQDPRPQQRLAELLTEHRRYIREHGEDMPSIQNWRWTLPS